MSSIVSLSEERASPARRKTGAGASARRRRATPASDVGEGLTPLQYMVDVLRDESQTHAVRMDAAKTAAPYVHPRLASAEVKEEGANQLGETMLALLEAVRNKSGGTAGLLRRD